MQSFLFLAVDGTDLNVFVTTEFTASHEVWYVISSFSFISQYFLSSFVISSLTHCLYWSVLFNFIISGYFPKMLLPSNLNPFGLETCACSVASIMSTSLQPYVL